MSLSDVRLQYVIGTNYICYGFQTMAREDVSEFQGGETYSSPPAVVLPKVPVSKCYKIRDKYDKEMQSVVSVPRNDRTSCEEENQKDRNNIYSARYQMSCNYF